MLRHLYAANTPHKNAATPFLEGRAEEVLNYSKHTGVVCFSLYSFWRGVSRFFKWGTRHLKNRETFSFFSLSILSLLRGESDFIFPEERE
jgi:hypothetical protein